jgi:two-component system response regulator HydG
LLTENNSCRILGNAPSVSRIRQTIDAVKDSESSVLIQGETGTGKEIVACNLHYRSSRCAKPFVTVNCAAIPRELIESELFGYERGAFTGAIASRIGRFEEASGGTVFLDEIGELEMSLQAKLLRVLQERTIERLGSNKKIKVDFRLISSTNRDLKKEVEAGTFREDLFYRINVVQIDVPPLRERPDDIPLLAFEFINHFCLREKKLLAVSDEVMEIFTRFPWPGNIRQLKNVVERAVVFAQGPRITVNELPDELRRTLREDTGRPSITPLKALELQAIRDALRDCNGNKSQAARKLGISRKALYKRLSDPCSPLAREAAH